MRKGFSSFLLLVTLLATLAPLLALAPQALPACCRAGGEHHCAVMIHLGGDGFQRQTPPCPYQQHPAVTPSHLALQTARRIFTVSTACEALYLAIPSSPRSAALYSVPKRGPPVS